MEENGMRTLKEQAKYDVSSSWGAYDRWTSVLQDDLCNRSMNARESADLFLRHVSMLKPLCKGGSEQQSSDGSNSCSNSICSVSFDGTSSDGSLRDDDFFFHAPEGWYDSSVLAEGETEEESAIVEFELARFAAQHRPYIHDSLSFSRSLNNSTTSSIDSINSSNDKTSASWHRTTDPLASEEIKKSRRESTRTSTSTSSQSRELSSLRLLKRQCSGSFGKLIEEYNSLKSRLER